MAQSTDLELNEDAVRVAEILLKARAIFEDRNRKYLSAFKLGGADDNGFQLRHKAIRMHRQVQTFVSATHISTTPPDPDDCFDLINYAVFLIMCIEDENWTGVGLDGSDGLEDRYYSRDEMEEIFHDIVMYGGRETADASASLDHAWEKAEAIAAQHDKFLG